MENSVNAAAKVQHVTKASSDELLRKFAEVGSESEDKRELRIVKRRKKSQLAVAAAAGKEAAVVERKSLLAPAGSKRSAALIRHLGIGKARVRARELRNRSFMGTIEKTWRKTIGGASKVFMEKHYNRHKRLINDIY
ncbi:PREDICTED: uncharacterized protein LOC109182058 [Ipomoea nil]|uniref:uncharacterized protein LOC109182058 n=1 Tax=Ipomoea nil TaxID=35883 RepID=UPI00090162D0|nr:PREDICTED: uncharacterized protein LOC109182058 [Ipomoea nil]